MPKHWTPPDQETVEEDAEFCPTNKALYGYWGISEATFYAKLKEYPELSEWIHRGRTRLVRDVMHATKKSALGGDSGAQRFILERCGELAPPAHKVEATIDLPDTIQIQILQPGDTPPDMDEHGHS